MNKFNEKLKKLIAGNPSLRKVICCYMLSHRMCSIWECNGCVLGKYKKRRHKI